MNIKLTVEYDGTDYRGWQVQPNGITVQQILEQALAKILGVKVHLNGSGRTDAGVHALGQVANFICPIEVEPWKLQRGINALTPADIVVKKVEIVPDSFDARRNAAGRVYQYRIWNHPSPSAVHRRFCWHVHEELNVPAMGQSVGALEGEHDFSCFQAAGCDAQHSVRKIFSNSLAREGDFLVYTVEATAFLRHMVRNIVGTLVEIGRGERPPDAVAELLLARDRKKAGPTAPAKGLFLIEVRYSAAGKS